MSRSGARSCRPPPRCTLRTQKDRSRGICKQTAPRQCQSRRLEPGQPQAEARRSSS